MIKFENVVLPSPKQWEAIIRGARNPMNSWDRSDSYITHIENPETLNTADFEFHMGDADKDLLMRLAKAGSDHAKKFTEEDFSMENLSERIGIELDFPDPDNEPLPFSACDIIKLTIDTLNVFRDLYNNATDSESKKVYWETMIQLLPSSYNQRRTIEFNYENLANMYRSRKNHKLQEWRDLCEWIKTLPHSELITLEDAE